MPRNGRRTAGGSPAQPIVVPTGQGYGEAGAQRAALEQAPMPDERVSEEQMMQAGLAQAQQLSIEPGGLLAMPDQNPGTPVQNGLAVGPGAGPEALEGFAPVDRTADVLRIAASAGGSPRLARLQRLVEARQNVRPAVPPRTWS